jgi:predicted nucleotidyltransferase component of viral defense system
VIPKAELLSIAEESGLLPTTIEKDHALGWTLFGMVQHPVLREWIFKGGTCLKKCYFDTYRFSEDLDFTLPTDIDPQVVQDGLETVADWVTREAGVEMPRDGIVVHPSVNKRNQETFQARLTFRGALGLPRESRQRIKFDMTHHELVALPPLTRRVFHPYADLPESAPEVRCYALEEILAEKIRALVQRAGRARDVYDVVNIGRNFRDHVDARHVSPLLDAKFKYKELPSPTPELILAAIDRGVLSTDWENALQHQVRVLPSIDEFLEGLREVLGWLLLPDHPIAVPQRIPTSAGERQIPVQAFGIPRAAPAPGLAVTSSRMDRIRFAARNRLLASVRYHGVGRLVEPYSLRVPSTGNLLLYVFEVRRGAGIGGGTKALRVDEIEEVLVTQQPFRARFVIEL